MVTNQARVPAGVRTGGQWSHSARNEGQVSLIDDADAQALSVVHRHLDAGYQEYAVLRPLLAQAEVAAQRISSGIPKEQLRAHVAERDALRALVDSTPVGLASLAGELRWTQERRDDSQLAHHTRAMLDERAAVLRVRRQVAQREDPHGMYLPHAHPADYPLPHLEPVCVPVVVGDTEHVVVSVVNVREFEEVGRFTVPLERLVDGPDDRPGRDAVLRAAREALPDLA